MEKSQNKVQYFKVHTLLFIEFCQLFDRWAQGVRQQNTTSLAQHGTFLSSISRAYIELQNTGYCVQ